jgi:hypothetical protein
MSGNMRHTCSVVDITGRGGGGVCSSNTYRALRFVGSSTHGNTLYSEFTSLANWDYTNTSDLFIEMYHLCDITLALVIQQCSDRTGICHTIECDLMILIGRVTWRSRYNLDTDPHQVSRRRY